MNRQFDEYLFTINDLKLKKNSQELISIQIDFTNIKEKFLELNAKLDNITDIKLVTKNDIKELDSFVEITPEPNYKQASQKLDSIAKWDLNYAKLKGFWKGHSKTDYWNPTGIFFNSIYNEIIVVDSFNHCLKVLNTQGKFLRSSLNENTLKLKTPRDLFIKNEKELIISDTGNHRMVIVNYDDFKLLREFGKFGCKSGEFNSPR